MGPRHLTPLAGETRRPTRPNHAAAALVFGALLILVAQASAQQCVDYREPVQPVGSFNTPGHAIDVETVGSFAFVTDRWVDGLEVIDVSNPTLPVLVGSVHTADPSILRVAVAGSHVFVTTGFGGLQVIDVTNPGSPTIVGTVDTPQWAQGIFVLENLAYVADGYSGLQVIDVSDPTAPMIVGSVPTLNSAHAVAVAGDYAYLVHSSGTGSSGGLQVIDVANPAAPVVVGGVSTPSGAIGVAWSDGLIYVCCFEGTMHVIDVSSPSAPTIIGTLETQGIGTEIEITGHYAYISRISSDWQTGSLEVIDVSNPGSPALVGVVPTPGTGWGVDVAGDDELAFAYVADGTSGLFVYPVHCGRGGAGGTVTADGFPLVNAIVDIMTSDGWFRSTSTDPAGTYAFSDVPEGPAEVSVVVPLGYRPLAPSSGTHSVVIAAGHAATCDFSLATQPAQGPVRSTGYWKHQVRVHTSGQGTAQETLEAMSVTYPTLIYRHFYENSLASIDLEGVTYLPGPERMTLEAIRNVLDVSQAPMLARAKQQYLALLLNVASSRLRSTDAVSLDGATASQAIQQVADQISDGATGNDERAKNLAEAINNAIRVAPGTVDLSIPIIPFAPQPASAVLERARPNPMRSELTLEFQVLVPGQATVAIYDVTGRLVRTLFAGPVGLGMQRRIWDGRVADGSLAANGVYFYRVVMPDRDVTSRFVVMR